ncbi:MAG: OsmC family protein [Thermoleophilia bacterium]|jgi:uncharacterized OsmC-like protein|nr:OsmC family protein [Thermoleophilia bacterium]
MGERLGLAQVRVRREQPGVRRATLLASGEEVVFGVPGFQADFYKFPEDGPMRAHAGTFDVLTASVCACLTSTLGGALTARGVPVDGDRLAAEADGVIEVEDGIMVLTGVEVRYRLVADPAREAEIMRAHEHHVPACGVARSVMKAIDIRTTLELVPEPA